MQGWLNGWEAMWRAGEKAKDERINIMSRR